MVSLPKPPKSNPIWGWHPPHGVYLGTVAPTSASPALLLGGGCQYSQGTGPGLNPLGFPPACLWSVGAS